MVHRCSRFVWLVVAFGIVVLPGSCADLKGDGKKLVKALEQNDYPAFQEMSTKRLAGEISKAYFERLSKSSRRLGKLQKLKQTGSRVNCSSSQKSATFILRFSKTEVTLYITKDKSGKIDAINFKGGGLDKVQAD